MASSIKKWFEGMGQNESKKLNSPKQAEAVRSSTPTPPSVVHQHDQRRRSSLDASPADKSEAGGKKSDSLKRRDQNKSPRFSLKRLQSSRQNSTDLGFLESLAGGGRRSRRTSAEQGPINLKLKPEPELLPEIPSSEIYVPHSESKKEENSFRSRALTIGNGQIPRLVKHDNEADSNNPSKVLQGLDRSKIKVSVVLRYTCRAPAKSVQRVYVAGSMTNWKSREMGRCKGETDFNLIIDCFPGKYFYKFHVDNEWCLDETQEVVSYMRKNSTGVGSKVIRANVITVKAEDNCVFEALACDSFATRGLNEKYKSDKFWGQHKPKNDDELGTAAHGSSSGPPILPPHLLNIGLNKESSEKLDPVLLPEPTSHVMLNHLYAQSIRDGILVMASTARYKKKCITIVYYKPA